MKMLLIGLLALGLPTATYAVYTCGDQETSSFVRISRARLAGTPVVISTGGDDLNCAQYCKNNIEPTTGAQRACASFNYDGRETCYFFDDAATPAGSAQLAANPSANNFYYEKVCLPGISEEQACTYRSYSFERIRSALLEGFVQKSVKVASREECLSTCLKEESFVCRSVNYNYNTYFCELSSEDRRTKPNYMRVSQNEPVDYLDNNCLSRQNRCGATGGNLVFVKTSDFEIHYYDHTSSHEAGESYCLQKCLDSLNTFCRSVEYSAADRKCIVSDEDTFSRADQQGKPRHTTSGYGGQPTTKDYYEPICVAADLSSSTCRQQSAFERQIGFAIQGQPIASAQAVTVSDCISLCFQNLDCKSINYDRTSLSCYIYAQGPNEGQMQSNPATDFYQFNCESQFGGMALCTNEGIQFIVNTKQPYTGAIYAAERFSTCSQVVQNARQITMTFPPPTISSDCGTELKDGKLEALVVVSLDGVLPHPVTTEWDRFYRVSCDTSMIGTGAEGSVVVTTIYDAGEAETEVLPAGTPGPMTATLVFLNDNEQMVTTTSIGEEILLVVKSEGAGPNNMMLMDCTATRVGGTGDSVPFRVIDNGCPRYPALVGPVQKNLGKNRLEARMKAFRLDGSYDIQMVCNVMFCATPSGCPPSNCLDSGNNQLFQSMGRKRRSVSNNTVDDVEETLSAIIRVLADGEDASELDTDMTRSNDLTYMQVARQASSADVLCVDATSLTAVIITMSLLTIVFTAIIIAWACDRTSGRTSKLDA